MTARRLDEVRQRAGAGEARAEDVEFLLGLVDRLCVQIAGVDRRERESTRKDVRCLH